VEAERLLLTDAQEMLDNSEWEIAYGIAREAVWRFPDSKPAWGILAVAAIKLGKVAEATEAARRGAVR